MRSMMKTVKMLSLFRLKPLILSLALVSIFMIQGIIPSPARAKKPKTGLVPAPLLKWPEQGSDYAVLVDKTTQKVFLYHRDNLFEPVKSYTGSTGENEGPKSREKDRKTPEGIYFFTKAFTDKDLAPIYGTRAFPINYPNPIDTKEGRKGYGIWFHGLNKPLKPKDTNGCIALDNPNIDDLAEYITLNDTPVVISPKIERVNPKRVKKEARELEKIIENWREAWENKEIDKYMALYHKGFTSGRKDWQKWRDYKTRLAKKYRRINVETDNLRILKNDGLVLAEFTQRYSTEGFRSEGKKRLYLKQNSRQWKIIGEYFREGPIKLAALKKPRISRSEEIRKFIDSWKYAWEQKNLRAYITSYDATFRSRGMDLRAWTKHRKRLNKQYRSLKIEITGLKISNISEYSARVSFKQVYRADQYRDAGMKKILLIKRGNRWKIKTEDWRPMRVKPRA